MRKMRSKSWWFTFFGLNGLAILLGVRAIDSVGLELSDMDLYPLTLVLLVVSVCSVLIPYLTVFNPEKADKYLRTREGRSLGRAEAEDRLSRLGGALAMAQILYGMVLFIGTSEVATFYPFLAIGLIAAIAYWPRIDRAVAMIPNQPPGPSAPDTGRRG